MPLPYRVKTNLQKVLDGMKTNTAKQFKEKLPSRWRDRVEERHINRILKGTWESLSRDEVNLYCNMARRLWAGEVQFFEVFEHPLWKGFFENPPMGFVDREPLPDSPHRVQVLADKKVLDLFSDGTNPLLMDQPVEKYEDVVDQMRTRNCLFVGGPKLNGYTEHALCALFKVAPFQRCSDEGTLPFSFQSTDKTAPDRRSAFNVDREGCSRGLTVTRPDTYYLAIPEQQDEDSLKSGRTAGVCVAVRGPLDGERSVTTLILAGGTAESTKAMAEDLLTDRLPTGILDLQPGKEQIFAHDLIWTRKKADDHTRKKVTRWLTSKKDFSKAAAFKAEPFPSVDGRTKA